MCSGLLIFFFFNRLNCPADSLRPHLHNKVPRIQRETVPRADGHVWKMVCVHGPSICCSTRARPVVGGKDKKHTIATVNIVKMAAILMRSSKVFEVGRWRGGDDFRTTLNYKSKKKKKKLAEYLDWKPDFFYSQSSSSMLTYSPGLLVQARLPAAGAHIPEITATALLCVYATVVG